jgi:hypothetical protein
VNFRWLYSGKTHEFYTFGGVVAGLRNPAYINSVFGLLIQRPAGLELPAGSQSPTEILVSKQRRNAKLKVLPLANEVRRRHLPRLELRS